MRFIRVALYQIVINEIHFSIKTSCVATSSAILPAVSPSRALFFCPQSFTTGFVMVGFLQQKNGCLEHFNDQFCAWNVCKDVLMFCHLHPPWPSTWAPQACCLQACPQADTHTPHLSDTHTHIDIKREHAIRYAMRTYMRTCNVIENMHVYVVCVCGVCV